MPEVIHIVDDDEGVRSSLSALLEVKGYSTQTHASSQEFLANLVAAEALCVLADLRMPGMGGLELQDRLLTQGIELPFIVVTGYGDVPSAVRALKSGAADFIEKPLDTKIVLAAVENAAASRRASLSASKAATVAWQRIEALTPRERDVLRHLVAGHPNKVIAHELKISPRTVENHRARLMVKMQVASVAELVKLALEAGRETLM
jgi:two-component system response regulator FixJ